MEDEAADLLLHDEHVLWRGTPRARVTPVDLVFFLVGLVIFLPFVGIFVVAATDTSTPPPQAEPQQLSGAGVLFLALMAVLWLSLSMLYMLGPIVFRRSWARRTTYMLTDQRAISVTSGRHRKVHAEFLRNVPVLNKKVRPDGSGSIAFGNVRSWMVPPMGFGMWSAQFHPVLMFWEIADVEQVYALADRHRRERLRDSSSKRRT